LRKILLADDEDNLRLLVHTTLEDEEYEIMEAENGSQALEMAREHLPDLVLLDWMMPGMTGVEVTAAIRADEALSGTPVILLTAKSQESDQQAGREAGVSDYIVKPFSPTELLEKVRRILVQT